MYGLFGIENIHKLKYLNLNIANIFLKILLPYSSTMNYTTRNQNESTNFLADELNGELCYVQTYDGKIVSIHYGMTDNYEGINIKRSIASAFQANFDSNKEDVEETDAGSVHTSHYR